jgi:hypothetical protein
VSAIDEFGGAAVSSVWESFWPFNRARIEISSDVITCKTPRGRLRAVRHVQDGSLVTIACYRYFPFCVRSIIWIDAASRVGFIPYRWRTVRDSLTAHRWSVEAQTKNWRTAVSDVRASWRSYIDTGEFPAPDGR